MVQWIDHTFDGSPIIAKVTPYWCYNAKHHNILNPSKMIYLHWYAQDWRFGQSAWSPPIVLK